MGFGPWILTETMFFGAVFFGVGAYLVFLATQGWDAFNRIRDPVQPTLTARQSPLDATLGGLLGLLQFVGYLPLGLFSIILAFDQWLFEMSLLKTILAWLGRNVF